MSVWCGGAAGRRSTGLTGPEACSKVLGASVGASVKQCSLGGGVTRLTYVYFSLLLLLKAVLASATAVSAARSLQTHATAVTS